MPEHFASPTGARQFIADQIAAQANREGVPLDDLERKMLLFSEVEPSLPDIIEVSDAFDRTHTQEDFEAKITRLIRNYERHARKSEPVLYQRWQGAVRTLAPQDHYINIMLNAAHTRPIFTGALARASHDRVKLIATAVLMCAALVLLIGLISHVR